MADLIPIDARDEHDRYYTPDPIASAYARWLDVPRGARVLEPSVGGGAWARALRSRAGLLVGVDIDPAARGLGMVHVPLAGDFADLDVGAHGDAHGEFDLVCGNPPFSVAAEHLDRALYLAPVVALLLRSTFVEPVQSRRDLLRAHPPWAVWMWPERIRFGGAAGSDSVLHGLHIWRRGHTGDSWTTTMCRPDLPRWMPPASPWSAP